MKVNSNFIKERFVAYLIDYFLIFFIMIIGMIFFTIVTAFTPDMTVEEYMAFQQFYMFTSLLLIAFGYFSISEWRMGTTIGKMIFIIGVKGEVEQESEEKQKISYKQSFIRNFSKMWPELMLIDFIIGLYKSPSKVQRFGEIMSETKVTEIPDPMRLRTKQARKVRRVFKIVLAIGGAFILSMNFLRDVALVISLIT